MVQDHYHDGGKLIGFGDAQTGNSSSYDRHVYMETGGQLTFGTWTGQMNTATSSESYNDGKWHFLVATQGADGMKLYVDGQQVATNPQTGAQDYVGYWRVGGDTAWNGTAYFAGTIDEAAVSRRCSPPSRSPRSTRPRRRAQSEAGGVVHVVVVGVGVVGSMVRGRRIRMGRWRRMRGTSVMGVRRPG